jgi:hypothetical protein
LEEAKKDDNKSPLQLLLVVETNSQDKTDVEGTMPAFDFRAQKYKN